MTRQSKTNGLPREARQFNVGRMTDLQHVGLRPRADVEQPPPGISISYRGERHTSSYVRSLTFCNYERVIIASRFISDKSKPILLFSDTTFPAQQY